MDHRNTATRRSFLTGLAAVFVPSIAFAQATPNATPPVFAWPTPIDLGGGIHLLDWRTTLPAAGSRFLAEIHNTTDSIVIAPTVGVVLPNLDSADNYGWGNPFTPVIHPGDSTFVVGSTPGGVHGDADWTGAEWVACAPGDSNFDPRRKLENLDFSIESTSTVHQPQWMQCNMIVTNLGKKTIRALKLTGVVRDADGRICGGTASSNLANIPGGDTFEMVVNIKPNVQMAASPFDFVDDLTGGTASFSMQPPGAAVNQGCPAVMPWNR